jgi:hypothetical protein
MFVGTEFGLFCTLDGGTKWIPLRSGLPTIAVRDLEIQRREHDLAVGTFGRGFYILDNYTPLRELSTELLTKDAHFFAIKKAPMYIESDPMAGGEKAYQGANFFTAPNPPFGATITFFLKDSLKTGRNQRQEKDRALAQQGKDVPYPSWEALKAEDREEAASIVLTVRDAAGGLVRHLAAPGSQGIHRVTWDFRYSNGPLAVPGTYTVSLVKRSGGQLTELIPPTPFEVEPLGMASLPAPSREEILAFQKQTAELQRVVDGAYQVAQDASRRLGSIKQAVDETAGLDPNLAVEVRAMQTRLLDMLERFEGDQTKPRRNEPGMPGINGRLQTVVAGLWSTTTGPTQSHRRCLEIAGQEYEAVAGDLRQLVEQQIPELEKKLEAAGAPWTPGRAIPAWRK